MAPEQARALEVTPRTDVYAMGIVAYEMLTGHVPFSCESAVETLLLAARRHSQAGRRARAVDSRAARGAHRTHVVEAA